MKLYLWLELASRRFWLPFFKTTNSSSSADRNCWEVGWSSFLLTVALKSVQSFVIFLCDNDKIYRIHWLTYILLWNINRHWIWYQILNLFSVEVSEVEISELSENEISRDWGLTGSSVVESELKLYDLGPGKTWAKMTILFYTIFICQ